MSRPWTRAEQYSVDAAILFVARRNRFFTADQVWAQLGPQFPVNKGLAARLNLASRRGLVENTGSTTVTRRPSGLHNHSQRLSVWRSKVYQGA